MYIPPIVILFILWLWWDWSRKRERRAQTDALEAQAISEGLTAVDQAEMLQAILSAPSGTDGHTFVQQWLQSWLEQRRAAVRRAEVPLGSLAAPRRTAQQQAALRLPGLPRVPHKPVMPKFPIPARLCQQCVGEKEDQASRWCRVCQVGGPARQAQLLADHPELAYARRELV